MVGRKPPGVSPVSCCVRLSLLDRSRTRAGHPEGAALTHTVERAVGAERLGYSRFWVAEHQGIPGIASGAPAVLLAAIGARTAAIRLGSGGVMLPNHQPLIVAEQFLMLAALYPGRVDIGLGRSLGFTAPVRRALRRPDDAPDSFADDIAEVRSYLERTATVTARPLVDEPLPLFVLATGRGIQVAARLGLPVVLGGPVLSRPELGDLLAAYRRDFRPHRDSVPMSPSRSTCWSPTPMRRLVSWPCRRCGRWFARGAPVSSAPSSRSRPSATSAGTIRTPIGWRAASRRSRPVGRPRCVAGSSSSSIAPARTNCSPAAPPTSGRRSPPPTPRSRPS